MIEDPYAEFKREEMILRDWLALDRTVLANKRTFLAYGRTAIALIILGMAFVKLINHQWFEIAGFSLIALGIVVFTIGLREFITNNNRFKLLLAVEKDMDKQRHDLEVAARETSQNMTDEQSDTGR
jgi:putative membrane protein